MRWIFLVFSIKVILVGVPIFSTSLFEAIQRGDRVHVQRLLEEGADLNEVEEGVSCLSKAVMIGDDYIIQQLLNRGANPNIAGYNNVTPLLIAIQEGHENVVDLLLRSEADPDKADDFGRIPMTLAIDKGYERSLSMLLQAGGCPNGPKEADCTPLEVAVGRGCEHLVEMLLRAGANPNGFAKKDGKTLLYIAVENDYEHIVQKLLYFGANPDKMSRGASEMPLGKAIKKGNEHLARLLLHAGAAPDMRGSSPRRPAHRAVERKNKPLVHILKQAGANMLRGDNVGDKPVNEAARQGSESIISLLLRYNVNPHHVSSSNRKGRMEELLAQAESIKSGNVSEWSDNIAMMALTMGHYELADEVMQQLNVSQAALVLLHALIIEHLRGDEAALRRWIKAHATQPIIKKVVEHVHEGAENAEFTAPVFIHIVRHIAEYTSEHNRLSSIAQQPYAMLYQILFPENPRNVLHKLGQRIACAQAIPDEVKLACQLHAKEIAHYRIVHGDHLMFHLVQVPLFAPYLKSIIQSMLVRALMAHEEVSYEHSVLKELEFLVIVAHDAGNLVGAQMLQSAHALFSSRLDPESIDHFLAFLPHTDGATVKQQQ